MMGNSTPLCNTMCTVLVILRISLLLRDTVLGDDIV